MKKLAALTVLVALAVLAAACSGPSAPALTLGSAPWQDGDKAVYDVVDGKGSKLGTVEFSIAKVGDAWLLTSNSKTGDREESSEVRIDASTLRPLAKEKTIQYPGTNATTSVAYNAGKAQLKAIVNGKEQSVALDTPATVFDSDQLLMTLRAMPFAEGYQGSLVAVVSENASKPNATFRVVGREKVQVPAGSVDTWHVEADFGGAKHNLWYAVEAPYVLVQHDDGSTKKVLSK